MSTEEINVASEGNENGTTDNGIPDAHGPGRDDDRKVFVGGIGSETTEDEMRDYFSKFGEVVSVTIKTLPDGRSRGFCFVVFADPDSVEQVMADEDHSINGKKIEPKKPISRVPCHNKIFVGGLVPEISDEEIRTHFEQFGAVSEVELPFDKLKNERKSFCFVIFEEDSTVTDILNDEKIVKQDINGNEIDVKKATPKPFRGRFFRGRGRGRGRGGRGGGGGAYRRKRSDGGKAPAGSDAPPSTDVGAT